MKHVYSDKRALALKDVTPPEELLRMIDSLLRSGREYYNKIALIKAIRSALGCSLTAGVELYNEIDENGLVNFKEVSNA
jgi:hypothetical protein